MKKSALFIFLALFLTFHLSAFYPRIIKLSESDPVFSQLEYEISEYYKRAQAGKPLIPLNIYTYTVKQKDSLFSICSLLNLTYDTIVSINDIQNPEECRPGDILLVPNMPGVFISGKPESGFEELLALRKDKGDPVYIEKEGSKIPYTFLAGGYLQKNERSFFLKTLFRHPLEKIYVTSGFGYRIHPVYGTRQFHTGIDYRAAIGTPVLASRDGVISETGVLGNYGLYIIIKHEGGYETVYSHLSKVNVKVNDRVISGQIIAESGNTGISTGPHLHFEIRKGGIPLNPADFFPGE